MTVMKEPEIPAPSMNSNHDKPTGTVKVEVSGKKSSLSILTKRDERDGQKQSTPDVNYQLVS